MAMMVWQPVQIHMDIEIVAAAQRNGVEPRPPQAVRTRLMPRAGAWWRRARPGAPKRVEWGHDEVHEVESFKKELRRLRRRGAPWERAHCGESSDDDEDVDHLTSDSDDDQADGCGSDSQKLDQATCEERAEDRGAMQPMKHGGDGDDAHDVEAHPPRQQRSSGLQPVLPSGPKPLRLARRLSSSK